MWPAVRRLWELRCSVERASNQQPLPPLWNAIVSCEQRLTTDVVPELAKGVEEELEPVRVVVSICEREDVLEQERSRPSLAENSEVVLEKARFRIMS
jgi:hypothetical protein